MAKSLVHETMTSAGGVSSLMYAKKSLKSFHTWAKSNANEKNPLFLISIRFDRRLNRA